MGKRIIRNHNLRREIADFVLNSSIDELLTLLCAMELENRLPNFFGCDRCKELFGDCPEDCTTEPCKDRMLKYDEMRDDG